jgi:hypothetical protein
MPTVSSVRCPHLVGTTIGTTGTATATATATTAAVIVIVIVTTDGESDRRPAGP